ncbi:MAG: helix-turn-helix transcriptional regulator [Deferrisomatales bacterium]|nr:helix-turn-helix transcriptional regulator [Deferrisomatales bacterium]
MPHAWIDHLRQQLHTKSQARVARELGYSPGAISQVLKGSYPADTEKIAERVRHVYGSVGGVQCPQLGTITPLRCAQTWKRAKALGVRVGNPATARLHKRCTKCPVRCG